MFEDVVLFEVLVLFKVEFVPCLVLKLQSRLRLEICEMLWLCLRL